MPFSIVENEALAIGSSNGTAFTVALLAMAMQITSTPSSMAMSTPVMISDILPIASTPQPTFYTGILAFGVLVYIIGLLGFRPNILVLHTLLCLYKGSFMY